MRLGPLGLAARCVRHVHALPFTKKSDDAPSWLFNTAAGLWNASSTAGGVRHVPLPTATGLWIDHQDAQVIEDPAAGTPAELFKLDRQDRVEVTDWDWVRTFNRGATKWRKVTVVSGTHIGQVGWTMSVNLARNKPA